MMLGQFGYHLEKHKVKYILYILQPPKTKIPDGTKCKPQKQNHKSTRRKHEIKKNLNSGGGFPKYYAKLQSHKKQD